jgi:hypothetical protein
MALAEDVVRFARSPMLRELGVPPMRRRGVGVIYANRDNLAATDNPPYIMTWQVADAFAEYEGPAGAEVTRCPRPQERRRGQARRGLQGLRRDASGDVEAAEREVDPAAPATSPLTDAPSGRQSSTSTTGRCAGAPQRSWSPTPPSCSARPDRVG